jgi:hypothetical protein
MSVFEKKIDKLIGIIHKSLKMEAASFQWFIIAAN